MKLGGISAKKYDSGFEKLSAAVSTNGASNDLLKYIAHLLSLPPFNRI